MRVGSRKGSHSLPSALITSLPAADYLAFCRPAGKSAEANSGSDSNLRDDALDRRDRTVCEVSVRTDRLEWLALTVINRHPEVESHRQACID